MNTLIFIITFLTAILSGCKTSIDNSDQQKSKADYKSISENKQKPALNFKKTQIKAQKAFEFCKRKNLNIDYCILIDMSLHSGVKRFVFWDFQKDTIRYSFLVGHGCCESSWSEDFTKENPKFSNTVGSHCSSLGKYKTGKRSFSNWGVNIKYDLHGLDSTNNNAFKRLIVFHSWEVVSDEEVYPDGTPEGWGCPIISNNSFRIIDSYIKSSTKAVLMWIYE